MNTPPTTWNEAIRVVCAEVADELTGDRYLSDASTAAADAVHEIDLILLAPRRWVLQDGGGAPISYDYIDVIDAALLGWLGTSPLTERLDRLAEVAALGMRKQRDYGTGNILAFGHQGLIVRMNDKLARVRNLLATGATAENEPLADSWIDLIGYSLIGLMLLRGWFELPLTVEG